jgi:hypothetical protein
MWQARQVTGVFLLVAGCQKAGNEDPPAASRLTPMAPEAATAASAPPIEFTERDRVALDGRVRAAQGGSGIAGPRVYAKALRAWIYAGPTASSERLGYLRAGASAPTGNVAGNAGCAGGWYPVVPRGFVCVGTTATLDPRDPVVVLSAEHPPEFGRKLPYEYGTVRNPGVVYARLPSGPELAQAEPDLEERMGAWLSAEGEIGASYGQEVWLGAPGVPPDPAQAWSERRSDPVPELLKRGGIVRLTDSGTTGGSDLLLGRMRPKVGYSFLHTFFDAGRRYGLTTDLAVLPTDRLRPIRGSEFRGVEIGREIALPFAFVRRSGARFYRWNQQKNKLEDDGEAPYRLAVPLNGKRKFFRGRLHEQTADGRFLSDRDASRIDPAKRMPAWGKAGERWLDVNITKQTLVAYQGEQPVFATLVSTGEAGLDDHEATTATKRGIFRIHTKHVSATMSSDEVGEEFELRDVPYVQYFEEGYALHGAYWHDRFGTPKSHGCINLSPEDARRLFFFTEPALPSGWHGVLKSLTGTVVFVHQ